MLTAFGILISSAALWIASTAVPSLTPSAVSKPTVAAGYWATWVICSGASASRMVATADSGVGWPELVRSCRRFKLASDIASSC